MSNPALGDINSTPSQMPGTSAGPAGMSTASGGGFGLSSPGIAYANWMPTGTASNAASMVGFLRNGVPPKSHGHVQFRSNDFITQAYTIAPWGDDSHLQITEGMAVFIGKEMDSRHNLTNMVSLVKLNRLCQQARMDYDVLSDPNNPEADPEAIRFRTLLAEHGERGLEQHHWARMTGRLRNWVDGNRSKGTAWTSDNPGDLPNRYQGERRPETALTGYKEGELDELWRLAHQPIYRYITRFGILRHWNFAGFVVAVSRGTSQETLSRTVHEDHILSVTVSMGKRTRVGAYWGDRKALRVGAQPKFVLRAKQLSDGSYGAMEIVPYVCFKRNCVPPADKSYYDESGHLIPGHVWSLGTIIEPPRRDGQEAQRQICSGTALDSTARMGYEAFGNIPRCYIAVGV